MSGVLKEIALGVRFLSRTPGFTLTAILSMTLGIGANTAIFSVVNALMLRPLPVRAPDELVQLTPGGGRTSWSNPLWEQIRERRELFNGTAAWSAREFDLASGGQTHPADGLFVSGELFNVLGVQPFLGRLLQPSDDRKGGGADGPVAVISYAFWHRQFGGGADIVGRPVTVQRVAFTIVGVTPPEFFGPITGRSFDVAIPIGTLPLVVGRDRLGERTWWWLSVVARLQPGHTLEGARAALASAQPAMREATRPSNLRAEDAARYLAAPIDVLPAPHGTAPARRTYAQPLVVLMTIVGVVLLIACVNVANLMIARAEHRRQDVSVRLALGATRMRLVRQFLIESLLIAVPGALLGLLLAQAASRFLVAQLSTVSDPVFLDLAVDPRVLAFTVSLAVASAVGFGLIPALRLGGAKAVNALNERGPGASSSRRKRRVGNLLVAAQVAISLVLLTASGLFVRTFAALIDRPLGFDADRVLVIQIDARQSTRPPQQRPALYQQMIEAVGAIPGVATASLSVMTPVSDNEWETVIENQPGSSLPEEERMVRQNLVGPDWFAVYGVPLLAGRGFEPADMAPDAPAVVISETFASRYFPGSNPVGHSIREVSSPDDPARPMTIVGIVKDSVYLSLREGPAPVIYRPITPAPQVSLSVRTTHASPVTLAPAIVSAIGSLDRDLSLTVRPLATDIRSSINRERLLAWLAGVFGTLAVLLAGIGLYGVASQAVAARRAEIGIRLALGATERAVVGLVTRNVALMFAAGVLLGMVLSGWAASFVGSLLYGVEPRDPATMIGAAVVLMTVGVAAGWAPARRASRIDPSEVLRRS